MSNSQHKSRQVFASANDLMNAVRSILPESSIGEDNEGQIIIYTNLYIRDDESLESMDLMECNEDGSLIE